MTTVDTFSTNRLTPEIQSFALGLFRSAASYRLLKLPPRMTAEIKRGNASLAIESAKIYVRGHPQGSKIPGSVGHELDDILLRISNKVSGA